MPAHKTRLFSVFLLCALCFLLANGPALSKCVALLIGVTSYQDTAIHSLPFVAEDIHRTEDAFKKLGYQVITMTTKGRNNKPGFADRIHIINELNVIAQQSKPGDTLVIYYSGHGFFSQTQQSACLACYDMTLSLPEETGISLNVIQDILKEAHASQLILVVDACQTSIAKGGSDTLDLDFAKRCQQMSKDLQTRQTSDEVSPSTAIFFSCKPGQSSYPDPENKDRVSVFTRFFTSALGKLSDQKADGQPDVAPTFSDIAKAVDDDMQQWSLKHGFNQSPDYLQYGENVFVSGVPKDSNPHPEGMPVGHNVQWLCDNAEKGLAWAQESLAEDYYDGHGGVQSYQWAAYWFRKAADQGDAIAENNLAKCFYDGTGVPQDYTQAFAWFEKAADQRLAEAQDSLGDCYALAQGVDRDYNQAAAWYRSAATQGNALAQYNLGTCYEYGHGVPKDITQAISWYRKAADQGNQNAMQALKGLGQ